MATAEREINFEKEAQILIEGLHDFKSDDEEIVSNFLRSFAQRIRDETVENCLKICTDFNEDSDCLLKEDEI